MGIVAEDIPSEDLMKEGVKVLIDRLGYANAARFIAILGGEGDSVRDIRERRMESDIDEITERIKRRRSGTGREVEEEESDGIITEEGQQNSKTFLGGSQAFKR